MAIRQSFQRIKFENIALFQLIPKKLQKLEGLENQKNRNEKSKINKTRLVLHSDCSVHEMIFQRIQFQKICAQLRFKEYNTSVFQRLEEIRNQNKKTQNSRIKAKEIPKSNNTESCSKNSMNKAIVSKRRSKNSLHWFERGNIKSQEQLNNPTTREESQKSAD